MTDPQINDSNDSMEGVAIIGLAGRFPKADNVDTFWDNLCNGVESISFFTDEELEFSGINSSVFTQSNYVKAGAILKDIELFDAAFFGFSPREAEITDPQHRFFLECAWTALENAGYNAETYEGRIGVYASSSINTYLLSNLYSNPNRGELFDTFQLMIGSDREFLPTHVSYKLNLKGPSVNVQTACSSSLVAVHLACQSLLCYQCDMALVGGVSIAVPHKSGYFYQKGGYTSPDGHCKAFDAKAQGTVAGNGVGIVVLKRLEDALADRDSIYAVIKGSAINNDGSSKIGYTAPSVDGQAEVIAMAQAIAGIEAETISYIEAHGTGTPLGDPIEIAALTQVFRTSTQAKGFCAIGSVKTNIGHLDAAAGVTGLIKTALALKHKSIPPSLYFENPNPEIDFANSPFYVNNKLSEWRASATARRAGVSSFGIGGTNAHVILEEASVTASSDQSRPWQLLLLSAKSSTALETATANLYNHLKQNTQLNIADVAYVLQVGRKAFNHRRAIIFSDLDNALSVLETQDQNQVFTTTIQEEVNSSPVVFMFPGGGTQYVNMGFDLYQEEPKFCEQVDLCSEILKKYVDYDLRDYLYPNVESTEEFFQQQMKRPSIALPALFTVEYALAQLWMSWGVRPHAMIGHSLGEYVAACLAGVFSLEDALSLVALRGQLVEELPSGAMLSILLPEAEVRSLMNEKISLAAVNAPSRCVVSGPTDAVDEMAALLSEKGVEFRRLHINAAGHSDMVVPIMERFTQFLEKRVLQPPSILYVSNVTGTWITEAEATDPKYWASHLRETVRFHDGISKLLQKPSQVLLEVGPGNVLSTLAKLQLNITSAKAVLPSMRHPYEQQSDVACIITTLSKLWLANVQLDWSGFYTYEERAHIPLPTYPFEGQRYWIEPQKQVNNTQISQSLLNRKQDIRDWFYIPVWKESVLATPVVNKAFEKQDSYWLVFADEIGLGQEIARQLIVGNQDVVLVEVGQQFSKLGDRLYAINPENPKDYENLLNELHELNKLPQAVVHLWSTNSSPYLDRDTSLFGKFQATGFLSLLFLVQSVSRQNLTSPLNLWVISNNICNVTGEETLYPEKATVLGITKVISQEYPNINCCNIDIVISESASSSHEKIVEQLLTEFTAKPSDKVIAYRRNRRWIQIFEPIQLNSDVQKTTPIKKEGVYLITDGFKGIGLELAKYLAKTAQAKLALIECSHSLEVGETQKLNNQDLLKKESTGEDVEHKFQNKLQIIKELEELKAEVLDFEADVSNLEQMQNVIEQVDAKFGKINGIIHAVSVDGGGAIQLKTPTMVNNEIRPKAVGTLVLNSLFKDKQLDFMVLCSSLNSITGGFGQVGHCAANAFLDAFAQYGMSRQGIPVVSINWDKWLSVWIKDPAWKRHQALTGEQEPTGMKSEQGADVFNRILLNNKLLQVAVSTQNLISLIEETYNFQQPLLIDEIETLQESTTTTLSHARRNLLNAYVPPRNELEEMIVEVWQKVLGVQQVGIHDNFFELGGDSLIGLQVLSQLKKKLNIEISATSLYEGPTVSSIAKIISNNQEDDDSLKTRQSRGARRREKNKQRK